MNNIFKKKCCSFCNKELNLSLKNHYIAINSSSTALFNGNTYYDAIDCDNCGRQNIMGGRYIKKVKKDEDIDE